MTTAPLATCLREAYGLRVREVALLPLGADANATVHRAVDENGRAYFVKLRRGAFDDFAVSLAKFLSDAGVAEVIAPLSSATGQLWTRLDDGLTVTVFPFVGGRNGFTVPLSERQWSDLGRALKRVHTAVLPPPLRARIREETFSGKWRESARRFLARLERESFDDPVSAELAHFLGTKRGEIRELIERAERLGAALRAQSPEHVLCHADLHAGNLLIDGRDRLHVADWDDAILAPVERDLMYVGGGLGFKGCTPEEEEARFFRGYGPTRIDPDTLAYYRCERIVQDVALNCEEVFPATRSDEERRQTVRFMKATFLPGGAFERASAFPRPTPTRIG